MKNNPKESDILNRNFSLRTLRFLFFSATLPVMKRCTLFLDQGEMLGGAERFLLDFFSTLSSPEMRRLNPFVVGNPADEYWVAVPTNIEILPFDWPSVRGNKVVASWNIFRSARKLAQLVREVEATQVFANTPRTMFVAYVAKKFFRMPVRMIVMIHDFTVPQKLLGRILRTADTIVVNSIPTRKYAREQLSKEHYKKLRIVENGVNLGLLPETEPVKKIQKVLMIGRIDPRKGQKFAVEAAAQLPELQFRIVGSPFPGDQRTMDYDCEIRDFVRSHNLGNVTFVPEVESPFFEMAKVDLVLALPTEPETFGRIVTESLACGRVVLAFDRTGPGNILRQFEAEKHTASLRAHPDDTNSLVERISFFVQNPKEVQKITREARSFVEKNYPLSETAKRLVGVLSE